MKQLTIDFKPNKYAGYSSVRDYINEVCIPELILTKNQYSHKKQIAADMDYSPSLLARKLSGCSNNVWSSDDTELFMKVTGCTEPVNYLAWAYLSLSDDEKDQEIERLRKELLETRLAK